MVLGGGALSYERGNHVGVSLHGLGPTNMLIACSSSNVIPRGARAGLAGLRPHILGPFHCRENSAQIRQSSPDYWLCAIFSTKVFTTFNVMLSSLGSGEDPFHDEPMEPQHRTPDSYRGTSLIRNSPPPKDHHRTLDTPTVGSYEGGVSYERGTPVGVSVHERGPRNMLIACFSSCNNQHVPRSWAVTYLTSGVSSDFP